MEPPNVYLVHLVHYDSELSGFYRLKTKTLTPFVRKALRKALDNFREPLEATQRSLPRDEWKHASANARRCYREWLDVLEDIMASLSEDLPTNIPKCMGISIHMVKALPVDENMVFMLATAQEDDAMSSDEAEESEEEYDDDSSESDCEPPPAKIPRGEEAR
jgi:hypothetical protein